MNLRRDCFFMALTSLHFKAGLEGIEILSRGTPEVTLHPDW
jgi:hypothetical protein